MVKVPPIRDRSWGDYYFFGRRRNATRSWVLEIIYATNQNIPSFNELFDQAPTGSGKTLAYVLPMLQIITQKRDLPNDENKCQIYALIVLPSRELVTQVADLLKSICAVMKLKILRLVGGGKINASKLFKGQCIMIATPGCLQHWSEKLPDFRNYVKSLLVLILDEVDRYSDVEFSKSMTAFLSFLPKQRRTGLFSATQAKNVEDFMKFGLRNPVRLNVASDKETKILSNMVQEELKNDNGETNTQSEKTDDVVVTPKELSCYYSIVDANEKFLALVNLLNSLSNAKVLLFVCSAASVIFFAEIFPNFLNSTEMFLLYRKLDKKKRLKVLEKFRNSSNSILISTDLMARGLDIPDIEWVIQYDIPKYSSMFIHRAGRTGRSGKLGKSLVFLTIEELGYLEFIQKHEKLVLEEYKIDRLGEENARMLNRKIQDLAVAERSVLVKGTKAFVSFVEAYCKHDCQIVCRFNDLNIAGIAHSFGLLRLPQMVELRKCGQKLSETFEGRSDVWTSSITYGNPKDEEKRQKKIKVRMEEAQGSLGYPKSNGRHLNVVIDEKPKIKRKKKMSEWEEFQGDANCLKKFKKGKMSKAELEEMI